MRAAGAERGWRGILAEGLGSMPGMFFGPISSAMGRGLAEGIPIDELAGAMHAVISNHPDCDADRRHRYSEARLRQDLKRLAARDARCMAQIDEIRRRLVRPTAEAKAVTGGAREPPGLACSESSSGPRLGRPHQQRPSAQPPFTSLPTTKRASTNGFATA